MKPSILYYHGTRASIKYILKHGIRPLGIHGMIEGMEAALNYYGMTFEEALDIPQFTRWLYGPHGVLRAVHYVYLTMDPHYAEGYARTGPDFLNETVRYIPMIRERGDYERFLDTLGTPKVIVIDGDKCGPSVVGGVQINYVPPSWILDYYEVEG